MKVAVFGAGAIGSLIGGRLAMAGAHDVTLVARGAHGAAMKDNGLELRTGGQSVRVRPHVVEDTSAVPAQDAVFVTLKAHGVADALPALEPLLGPETTVIWAVNGLPWWYFHGLEGPWRDRRIAAVDPGDLQWRAIGPDRIVGCVVFPAAEVESPGVVRVIDGDRLSLGEPDGRRSSRIGTIAAMLIDAGFKAPVRPRIRDEIWLKLWGNLSFNPISVLTSATLEDIVADAGTRAVARSMMIEAQAIAERLGVVFPIGVDRRIEGAGAVGPHRTSMLQDFERRRPLEFGALVGAVQELGATVGVATPVIDTIASLVRLRAKSAGVVIR